jgi:hypothetical protein
MLRVCAAHIYDEKIMSYLLEEEIARTAAAREFHTGDKPDEDRIAREVLGKKIDKLSTKEDLRDILTYIAIKAGLR